MSLLKNITTASIAGVLLFSLSCDDRLPSESAATVETGSLELSYVFVSERGFRKSNSSSFKGKDILSIKKRKLEDVPLKYLKEITTKAIGICLEGKDLTSRKIFKSIKKWYLELEQT